MDWLRLIAPTIASALGGPLVGLNLGLLHTQHLFQTGFLPGIFGPCMIPIAWPSSSSARSRRIA
jgi:hypothetical protein